ncbi:MAG: hypothetical protein ACI81G_000434, partial [Gammaproteobacteria bacterium]
GIFTFHGLKNKPQSNGLQFVQQGFREAYIEDSNIS